MKIKSVLFLFLLILTAADFSFAAEQKPFHQNSWFLQGGVFYIDHPGGDFNFKCEVSRPEYKITEKTAAANLPAVLIWMSKPNSARNISLSSEMSAASIIANSA